MLLSNMKTLNEWISIFKTEINEGYEINRMDKQLAEYTEEVENPTRQLLKLDEPIKEEKLSNGTTKIVIPTLKTREVEPFNAGYMIDLSKWLYNPEGYGIENYMRTIGINVALKEIRGIIKGISENTSRIIQAEQKGELSKEDLQKARDMALTERYADTILIPSKQRWRFLRRKELWEPHLIPTTYVPEKFRGPYYAGNINDVRVYENPVNDFALVFSRKEIMIKNTHLKIEYIKRENTLAINKWCSAAPIREETVVRINL